ncbi:MAG: SRPBCC domain-containing protein [Proteobacteria bacterium]|nr:MAG: SRPBCC domain-containing protein [Pseudomonadota bacterium]
MLDNSRKDKPIQVSRVVSAGQQAAFEAFTEADKVKQWYGPKNFTCPVFKSDLRVGGKYLSCMRSPEDKDFWSTGSYKEIIPGKKLVYTDSFSDPKGNILTAYDYGMSGDWPLECEVSITFSGSGDQTTITLVHQGIPPEEQDDCMKGWEECLTKLDAMLSASREPRISYHSNQSSSYNAPSPL